MILVTGANGHLGNAVVDFFLKKNPDIKIKALVRSEEKGKELKSKGVEIAIGDYFDYDSLVNAMENVDSLLFVSSGSIEDRLTQHLNVIKAAKQCDISHIVYTSVLKANPNSKFTIAIEHLKTEEEIMNSGIDYTLMRHTYYADILPDTIGNFLESGVIYYSAGNTKVNFATRMDMAEANANVLLDLTKHKNKIYEITSGKAYSFTDIAEMLSQITGKKIEYFDIPIDKLKENVVKAGMPNEVAEMTACIAESIKAGEFDYTDPALENLLGRKPVDLKEFFTGVYVSN